LNLVEEFDDDVIRLLEKGKLNNSDNIVIGHERQDHKMVGLTVTKRCFDSQVIFLERRSNDEFLIDSSLAKKAVPKRDSLFHIVRVMTVAGEKTQNRLRFFSGINRTYMGFNGF